MAKPFLMTAFTDRGNVTFGILGRTIWVRVDLESGETVSSIDSFKRATLLAESLVHTDLWPAFVSHMKPSVQMDTLF